MEHTTGSIRSISVEHWHQLAMAGSNIALSIFLNGDSMRPLIRRNTDRVTIIPLHRPVRPGDIVLFSDAKGRYVVHRVWKQNEDHVVTLGDHCIHPDRPLHIEQVWGLVTKVQRGHRTLPLDNAPARCLGRCWMLLLPLRACYTRMRKRGKSNGNQ